MDRLAEDKGPSHPLVSSAVRVTALVRTGPRLREGKMIFVVSWESEVGTPLSRGSDNGAGPRGKGRKVLAEEGGGVFETEDCGPRPGGGEGGA